ncbi:hypothetical protein VSU01S_13320 [Vibrio superstes NBRC 103154]|uniref:Uncharacterized protein n=1 Tax=Vibrio superstes NBRC 103154 TaxID=1219062 RepID=A0A511QPN9_9VIBR|nr:hypothetical protein VSU01S_13320 [Vibrio superstes NBRC 103154]
MINGILGGIITPIIPAEAVRAEEKSFLYPCCVIEGIMFEPIAATVAGAEPEIAAKNIDAMTFT